MAAFQAVCRAPRKLSIASISGTRYAYLSFPRNRYATDVAISYESSTDLHSWSPVASELVGSTVTDFGTDQITLRVPATMANQALRPMRQAPPFVFVFAACPAFPGKIAAIGVRGRELEAKVLELLK